MNQSIRIIGGKFRGKKIYFPSLTDLRPTPDRVKETLFNWLMHDIQGARCLDAFAGSGALGLEAFSRGAKRVLFVESAMSAYTALQQTAAKLSTSDLLVIHAQAENYLRNTADCFDIIFLDPPFASNQLKTCIALLEQTKCFTPGGLLYLETPLKPNLNPQHWQEKKAKRAGQVFYSLYEKVMLGEAPASTSA